MKLFTFLIRFQRGRCYLCGKPMQINQRGFGNHHQRGPTFDHVRPKSRGWSRDRNSLLAHRDCNESKGSKLPTACALLMVDEAHRAYEAISACNGPQTAALPPYLTVPIEMMLTGARA